MSNIMNEELPNLHDAALRIISHNAEAGTVQCVFHTQNDQDAVLLLSGVTQFRCTDFGLQNVVLELIISSVTRPIKKQVLQTYVSWLSMTADGEQLTKLKNIELAMQDIEEGRLKCVFLIPSWGAQLGAIAEKVEWQ